MRQHLLRVERPVIEFEPLIAAVRHDFGRVGWLELVSPQPLLSEVQPASLEEAARCGVMRAVAVGRGRSVTVKPMRGAPVIRDLLREHFRGCVLVLVTGEVNAPLLEPCDAGWRIDPADTTSVPRSTEELVGALRKPRPWG